ncbi:hypothetical protein C8J57DRAFT_1306738 [Mycena rebaudengoi]|nr:hypothetical protein C8J57DRAFT_1306738 [Mycena rebaudengoi]
MQGSLRAPFRGYRLQARWVPCVQLRRYATAGSLRPPPLRALVSTLNPRLLLPCDFLDISHRKTIRIFFPQLGPGWAGDQLVYLRRWQTARLVWESFPPRSRGFLYYRSDPELSPLAGSIRFRTTTDKAVSSFRRGQDLLLPSGMPWQTTIPQIATQKSYAGFCQHLLQEGMVTEELLRRSRAIFANTVFGLKHPFLVNFGKLGVALTFASSTTICEAEVKPFSEWGPGRHLVCPFTGSGVARFERSTLPEHVGKRVLLLRILKILEPVTCTIQGYAGRVGWPKEGELLTVSFRNGSPRPWSYDVDRDTRTGIALRNLVDT